MQIASQCSTPEEWKGRSGLFEVQVGGLAKELFTNGQAGGKAFTSMTNKQ